MKAIQHLIKLEEKKLSVLGKQKNKIIEKKTVLLKNYETISFMLDEYQNNVKSSLIAIHLINQRNLFEQILPLKDNINKQLEFISIENNRLNDLWQKQLKKCQSLKWYIGEKEKFLLSQLNKQEQKTSDDLAARMNCKR